MPCKTCGHKANEHDYNHDWKVRGKCHPKSVNGVTKPCNCKEFVK